MIIYQLNLHNIKIIEYVFNLYDGKNIYSIVDVSKVSNNDGEPNCKSLLNAGHHIGVNLFSF